MYLSEVREVVLCELDLKLQIYYTVSAMYVFPVHDSLFSG
jgi:hypothetical protein